MKIRQISIIAGVAVLVLSYFYMRQLSEKKQGKRFSPAAKVQVVNVLPATISNVSAYIPVTGKLVAQNRMEVFAEVSGIYKTAGRPFKEGVRFSKGETLIKIDSDEAYQDILAKRSELHNLITDMLPDLKLDYPESFEAWDRYLRKLDVKKTLTPLPEPVSEKEKFFVASKNIYNLYYTVKSQEERLAKYNISAPFSGVVAESLIDPGTLVRSGQKLGEYIDPSVFELRTTISLKDLNFIKPGDKVNLQSSDIKGVWTGTVARISDKLDENTQSAKIFVQVSGKGLKEGMFLSGGVSIGNIDSATALPRNILLNDKEVFLIKDSLLTKSPVEVVRFVGDSAIVRGLPAGALLLNESIPGAFEGMKVMAQGGEE
ncbi:HlyD family efflux transporter periplasmic adaptor subunit [Cytophagaceae bacterium ABcell3]|nr:HlyD family efflux transporter periplasmic adaptor subunit [Cytophagaceae bacterium ABcell3]